MARRRRSFGISFSAKRALGISAAKGRLSRKIGVPLTKSGRDRKIGSMMQPVIGILFIAAVGIIFGKSGEKPAPTAAASEAAETWSPADPNDESTKVNFTAAWARKLRAFHSLVDIQRAAKAKGKITERQLHSSDPQVAYHFRGFDGKHLSYMLVVQKKSGFVGISITTDDGTDIVLNNAGGFNCDPPGAHETSMGDHCR